MPKLRRTRTVLVLAAVVATAASAEAGGTAATYYVSPSGSDTNPGTQSSPWRTVDRVNRATLNPGDTVLFQGGATYSDQTLTPPSAGAAGSPITFGSYGTGKAQISNPNGAVWMASGVHDLVFDNLDLTSSNSIVFAAAGSGAGASGITLQNSTIHDSPYAGVVVQPQDSQWTIDGNTFRHLGDSGLLVQGSQVVINQNTITDTGWNPALTYGKHGIYAKGPGMTISNNDISSQTNGSAISLRYAGARVFGNRIHDTNYAVSFFPQDPSNTGVDRIYYNRMWNISGFAFYYAGTNDNGQPAAMDVTWDSNTVVLVGGAEGVNLSEITAAHVEVANNVFTGSIGSAYRGCATCSEHNNDWFGAATNVPNGLGDKHVDPGLSAAPALAPSSTSPVVDAGTAAATTISYSPGCDGAVMHYCLQSPDQGAVEYVTGGSLPTPPPPPPPPADTTPPSVPGNLAFTGVSGTGGLLSWSASTDNVGVTGYTVSVDGGQPASTVATSFTVSGLTCATSHSFAVRAKDAAGNLSAAATLSASTSACPAPAAPPADTTPPSAPGNLAFSGVTGTGGLLSWSASTDDVGVTGYWISVNGSQSVSTTATSYAVSGLTCGTTYSFDVRAQDAAGNLSPAATLSTATHACPVSTPTVHAHKHGDSKVSQAAGVAGFARYAHKYGNPKVSQAAGVAGFARYPQLKRLAQVASAAAVQAGG